MHAAASAWWTCRRRRSRRARPWRAGACACPANAASCCAPSARPRATCSPPRTSPRSWPPSAPASGSRSRTRCRRGRGRGVRARPRRPRGGDRGRVRTRGRTGVEMEALTAVAAAALTLVRHAQGRRPRHGDRRDRAVGEARRPQRHVDARTRCQRTASAPRPTPEATRPRRTRAARMSAAASSLSYAEARSLVLAAVAAARASRSRCATRGPRAARDVVAPHALPPFRNTAMDGFAVRAADLAAASDAAPVTLPVVAVLAAGRARARTLARGEAMRIMTGAMLPAGADAVRAVRGRRARAASGGDEQCVRATAVRAGENVRDAGADIATGARARAGPRTVGPRPGAARLTRRGRGGGRTRAARGGVVHGRRAARSAEPLRPGAIRDSNLPMLCAARGEARLRGDAVRATAGRRRARRRSACARRSTRAMSCSRSAVSRRATSTR